MSLSPAEARFDGNPTLGPRRPWRGGRLIWIALVGLGVATLASATPSGNSRLRRGGLKISINQGRPIVAAPAEVVVFGTTNAPPGSILTVTIDAEERQVRVAPEGEWRIEWDVRLELGRYAIRATVVSPDERHGRGKGLLIVAQPGQLPRRAAPGMPREAPGAAPGPEDFTESTDRWRLQPPPYELSARPGRWDPYNQNKLKGDLPIRGDDLFLVLTGISDTLIEVRTLPTPAGISTAGTDIDFFGGEEQVFTAQNLFFSTDLFKGDTAFRPIDWRLKATVVANGNDLRVEENAIVNPDVRRRQSRTRGFLALQELFFEYKLADLGPNYDFLSLRVGIQPFTSDFRGFIFSDVNLGVRLFGNFASNRYQYNLAFFERLEKDTNSGLNTFELRDQRVGVLNLYRQDFLARGHTAEVSVHYLRDEATFLFDKNDFLARPDATGDFTPHEIEAVYLGFATFGHVGRLNVDTAFYYVTGTDSLNPIAGSELVLGPDGFVFDDEVDIEAYQIAVDLSIDRDWVRPRIGFFLASGDDNLGDRDAEGFDAIFENVNFAGGGFSFWNRAAIRLAGTAVALVNRGSPLPDLSSSKEEGQPNFVNPGLQLLSLGLDLELTPKLRTILTANHLRFDTTEVLEGLLFQTSIDEEIGWDLSLGARYRPYLNQNFVVVGGVATLLPGDGFADIFEDDDPLYQLFANVTLTF